MIYFVLMGVCLLSNTALTTSSPLNDALENQTFQSSGLAFCNKTVTRKTDAIIIAHTDLLNGPACLWHINVTSASTLSLLFLPLPPANHSFVNAPGNADTDAAPAISVYTSYPVEGQDDSVLTWTFQEERKVQSFDGSQLWLLVSHQDSQYNSELNRSVAVSYVAENDGYEKQKCSVSGPREVDQGVFDIHERSFGSVAVLTCNDGYVIPKGSPKVSVCITNEDEPGYPDSSTNTPLTWSQPPFLCENICKHPPGVDHATVYNSKDISTLLIHHTQEHGSQNATITTETTTTYSAQYTCQSPYLISPVNHSGLLSCTVPPPHSTATPTASASEESASAPAWTPQFPTCTIPDCTSTIVLTQHNGALVNPAYPSSTLLGGRRRCRWEINAPVNSFIRISVTYADLPISDNSTKVELFDEGHARPVKILTLSGSLEETSSVTSETSKVLVIYTGPAASASGYRGFYLEYSMRPNGSKFRIGDSGADASNSSDTDIKPGVTSPGTGEKKKSGSPAVDNGIIAVSVIVPLVVLVLILVGGYFWYRRRYPVRMIIGRDVSKFTNPKYAQPRRGATLVRNDAERFFNRPQDYPDDIIDDAVTLEMNPVSPTWGQYDNPGYQGDEADNLDSVGNAIHQHHDDDEEERMFREKKSWLFRRSEDKGIDEKMRRKASDRDSIHSYHSDGDTSSKKGLVSKEIKENQRKVSVGEASMVSDISELLNEQQVTPGRARRGLSRDATTESSSTTDSVASTQSVTLHDTALETKPSLIEDLTGSAEEEKNGSAAKKSEDEQSSEENEESSFMRTAKVIFEQPSLEQVMAEVKARSRSMSVGTIKLDSNTRQRSYSVDPTKSARKCSLHDETILAAFSKSLAERKILETPISSASSHHSMDSAPGLSLPPKPPLTAQSSLSASIVGEEIKVSSNASTISGGSSLSIHSFDGSDTEERRRAISLVSTNSNPHLVTDLDAISQRSGDDKDTELEHSAKDAHQLYAETGTEAIEDQSLREDEEDADLPTLLAQSDLADNRDPGLDNNTQSTKDAGLEDNNLKKTERDILDPPQILTLPEYEDCSEHAMLSDNLQSDIDVDQIGMNVENKDKDRYTVKATNYDVPAPEINKEPCMPVDISPQNQRGFSGADANKPFISGIELYEQEMQPSIGDSLLSGQPENDVEEDLKKEISHGEDDPGKEQTSEDSSSETHSEESEIPGKPAPSPRKISGEGVVGDDVSGSSEESSDDSASNTSESDGSGVNVRASYNFGGGDDSEEEEREERDSSNDEEKEEEADDQDSTTGIASAKSIDLEKQSKLDDLSRSSSPDSEPQTHLASASTSSPPGPSLELPSPDRQKRVKILPLPVNISDDDDDDDDDDDEDDDDDDKAKVKITLSDDDISDILDTSSDESQSGETGSDRPASSPTTYTFQQFDSDDEDIDV